MIYIRLYQAENEGIEDKTSWVQDESRRRQGNFARIAKISLE